MKLEQVLGTYYMYIIEVFDERLSWDDNAMQYLLSHGFYLYLGTIWLIANNIRGGISIHILVRLYESDYVNI